MASPIPAGARAAPDHVTIFRGWSRLTTDVNGGVPGAGRGPRHALGFACANTVLLDGWSLTLNGRRPERTLAAPLGPTSWFGTFWLRGSSGGEHPAPGTRPRGGLELRLGRIIDGGLREELWLTNYDEAPRRVRVRIRLRAAIAEEAAVIAGRPRGRAVRPRVVWTRPATDGAHGRVPELWLERRFGRRRRSPTAELARRPGRAPRDGDEVRRGLVVRFDPQTLDLRTARIAPRRDGFALDAELPPRSTFRATLLYEPLVDGARLCAPTAWDPAPAGSAPDPQIDLAAPAASLIVARARADLDALALPVFPADGPAALSAGVPLYLGLFGRDNLIAVGASALFSTARIDAVLERLGRLQARRHWPWRAEDPGRLPHERRLGPAGALGRSASELYYGDIVSPPLWLLVLGLLHQWTGEPALLARHADTARRCADWILDELARGGGFVWDRKHRGDRTRNHGWKDSDDAIVDGDGRVHDTPIALVEEQGWAYRALLTHAQLYPRGADRLVDAALALRARFEARFWLPHRSFYALALDRDGAPIDSLTSNVAHALGAGIVDERRVPAVVARLFAPDLFSGWGVRTLSVDNPAYDPFAYHRGTVWPMENASLMAALAQRGLDDEAARLAEALFTLATRLAGLRLPECVGGQPRDSAHPLPGLYPRANPVQAWSASAIPLVLQGLLGLEPDAPRGRLRLRPRLPPWLPGVRLHGLRVGRATLDLHAWRHGDHTRWRVTHLAGRLLVDEGLASAAPLH